MDKGKLQTFVLATLNRIKTLFASFSLRWKIFFLIAALLGLSILIIAPREASIVREDKITFVKDLTGRLTRSTAKSFLNRINSYQDKLIIFTSYRESLAHTSAKIDDQLNVLFSQEQEFLSIGLVSVDDKGAVTPSWVLRNPQQANAAKWPADTEQTILSKISTVAVAGKGRALWSVQGPDRANYFVFGLRVEIADPKPLTPAATPLRAPPPTKTWITGILPGSAFDDLFTDFSTGVNKAYLLDEQGVAIAASDSSLRLKNLKEDQLFNEALKKSKSGGASEYILNGKKVIGGYEAVEKTNLVTVVVTPEDRVLDVAESISQSVHFIGLIFLLFALALTILFSNYFLAGPLQKLKGIVAQWGEGRFTPLPADLQLPKGDELSHLAHGLDQAAQNLNLREEKFQSEQKELTLKEKMKAFSQFSAGVTKEIKNPLSGILGHIQLAAVKAPSEDVKKHLDIAEQEIRRCKGVLESLARVSQTEKLILKPVDLTEVVDDAILQVDHQLALSQVKVFKDIRPCPLISGDSVQLKNIVVSMLLNAAQSMEGTSSKEKNITIRIMKSPSGSAVEIQIEDTGSGITSESVPHIFEPFYTTKSPGRGMGLSLSVSLGVMREHGGDITFQSERGKGTLFVLSFPVPEKALSLEESQPLNVKPIRNPESEEITVMASNPIAPTIRTETETDSDSDSDSVFSMPPIPEEVLERGGWSEDDGKILPAHELTQNIPSNIPVASAALKAHVAEFAATETVDIAPDLPGLVKATPVQIKTVNDFKVQIRRPKLRT